MQYEPVIGLEIHAELKTQSKMFCDSPNDPDESHPNVNVCPICMGHPGTLPVANRKAVTQLIRVGLALGGAIPEFSRFDRKHYFYPDLPKGYQISQYEHPLVRGGWLDVATEGNSAERIRIQRVHLEEDTGRLVHEPGRGTLVDFNRAGIPLMELVTEPDIRSAAVARTFAEELQRILQYLEASNANMEKGEMRIEANVSLRPTGRAALGTKVEVKNINSFRFVERAIAYEIKRQEQLLDRGQTVIQETRGWDEAGVTVAQRRKEESHDYRYLPEPDLPPLRIDPLWVEQLRRTLPELPRSKLQRFMAEFGLDRKVAGTIVRDRALAAFFEATISELKEWSLQSSRAAGEPELARVAANYLTTDVLRYLGERKAGVSDALTTPEDFAELISYLLSAKISSRTTKDVLREMFSSGADPSAIIEERGWWQLSDATALAAVAERVIAVNEPAARDYRTGKAAALQFLVGQVMRESPGANPEVVRTLLEERLR